jgi:hypothetical protein
MPKVWNAWGIIKIMGVGIVRDGLIGRGLTSQHLPLPDFFDQLIGTARLHRHPALIDGTGISIKGDYITFPEGYAPDCTAVPERID